MPVVYVDYPGPASLTQIYGTFNRAMLRLIPSLRTYAEPLTAAMVEFYTMSQVRLQESAVSVGTGRSLHPVSLRPSLLSAVPVLGALVGLLPPVRTIE